MLAGGITQAQARDLTRVQRRAVAAITGSWREDYTLACPRLGIEEDLNSRHLKLCKTFLYKKATKSRYQDLFTKIDNPHHSPDQEWRQDLEGVALLDSATPPVGPASPDQSANRRK